MSAADDVRYYIDQALKELDIVDEFFDENENAKDEIENLEARIKELDEENGELQDQVAGLEAEVEQLKEEIAEIEE